jgi:hypothetical protein
MKPTPKAFASRLAPLQNKFSVVATTPSTSSRCPASMLRLKLVRCPHSLAAYSHNFYVDHSHCLVLAPATLAALPSTRAIPDRDVFNVAWPPRLHSLCSRTLAVTFFQC